MNNYLIANLFSCKTFCWWARSRTVTSNYAIWRFRVWSWLVRKCANCWVLPTMFVSHRLLITMHYKRRQTREIIWKRWHLIVIIYDDGFEQFNDRWWRINWILLYHFLFTQHLKFSTTSPLPCRRIFGMHPLQISFKLIDRLEPSVMAAHRARFISHSPQLE